ncbi:hypothetical protein AVEN_49563-1 [Araneus ventricosus]|uniref:Uncharacterized protein n=1 Tax=Araneus ventricosus TaxID=182803 RepID=A0A4Y2MN85_ARAVE|nr:hypothetical protein AVEN_49563-1 [Araneus ventricosus]
MACFGQDNDSTIVLIVYKYEVERALRYPDPKPFNLTILKVLFVKYGPRSRTSKQAWLRHENTSYSPKRINIALKVCDSLSMLPQAEFYWFLLYSIPLIKGPHRKTLDATKAETREGKLLEKIVF